jgi:hypothetical protein
VIGLPWRLRRSGCSRGLRRRCGACPNARWRGRACPTG